MADLDAAVAAIRTDVEEITGVVQSAIAAFSGIGAVVADLQAQLAAGTLTQDQAAAALGELGLALDEQKEALAAAIVANP